MEVLPLERLGRRIMICGPSNSGKSTLAAAIAVKLGIPAIHLDTLRHLPNTDWEQRSDQEFSRLHDEAIEGDGWVVDGNYSALAPQRLARATGIILLGGNRWINLARYVRRTLLEPHRAGNLEGAQDSLKWQMIHWIVVASPPKQAKFRGMLRGSGLPLVELRSMRELQRLYMHWDVPAVRQRSLNQSGRKLRPKKSR